MDVLEITRVEDKKGSVRVLERALGLQRCDIILTDLGQAAAARNSRVQYVPEKGHKAPPH